VSASWRVAAVATFALIALQFAWAWEKGSFAQWFWLVAILVSLPLLPVAGMFLLRRPRSPLWAGIAALFYFCLGVTSVRVGYGLWAWLEIALALVVIFAAGWPGIAAKMAKRRAPPPPNV
jgi:uncharacterized membrane protein